MVWLRLGDDGGMEHLAAVLSASPASTALLAAFVLISLIGLYAAPLLIDRCLFRPHFLLPRRQYASIVSSAFVHADLPHLLFNGVTFWAFAFPLERAIGSARLLALYGFGLWLSAAGVWLRHRHDPGYRSLGASGAILAVLFAFIVYFPGASMFILPIPVPIPAPLFALAYLGYSVWAARQGRGRVAHDAHLAGAAAGVVFVLLSDGPAVARALQRLPG